MSVTLGKIGEEEKQDEVRSLWDTMLRHLVDGKKALGVAVRTPSLGV